MEAQVARVGWEAENPAVPIILMDKVMRTANQFDVGTIVKTKHGQSGTSLAVVERQFQDLTGSGKFTVNQKLSTALDCLEGDTIEITGKASEDEMQQFNRQMNEAFGQHMRDMLRQSLNSSEQSDE
jgi:hypothetical protein